MPDEPVRVLTTSSILEGEIAKARLEDEGIPVFLKGEGEGPYRLGPVHLYVPGDLEVQARLILSADLGLGEDDGIPQDAREDATERRERPGPAG